MYTRLYKISLENNPTLYGRGPFESPSVSEEQLLIVATAEEEEERTGCFFFFSLSSLC